MTLFGKKIKPFLEGTYFVRLPWYLEVYPLLRYKLLDKRFLRPLRQNINKNRLADILTNNIYI
jgi:hypothetical protein